jgi:hypothetical protein
MKVFITGSTGLLGNNLVPLLVEQGYSVEQEARELLAGSRGEGTERGIRPNQFENHLTLIGGLRPMFRSAPPLLVGVISPQLIAPFPLPLR